MFSKIITVGPHASKLHDSLLRLKEKRLSASVPSFGAGAKQVSRSRGSGECRAAAFQRFAACSNAQGHRAGELRGLVERQSRFVIIVKVADKRTETSWQRFSRQSASCLWHCGESLTEDRTPQPRSVHRCYGRENILLRPLRVRGSEGATRTQTGCCDSIIPREGIDPAMQNAGAYARR
jgi:hypothetical protein